MPKKIRIALILVSCLLLATLFILYVSTSSIPVLHPKGMIGEQQRDLIIISSLLMCIVVIPVFVMLAFFSWKYREGKGSKYSPNWSHNNLVEWVWWGVPFLIVVVLAVITWRSTHELNPYTPIEGKKPPLVIQVVALDWKWLFIYPAQGIATVNYIQFPVDTPLAFEITADAPMNSFWIPQLGGQIYAMPAMRTKLHLIANEEGSFRGCSANISGSGFAGMSFTAVASSQDEFRNWIAQVRKEGTALSEKEYGQLMQPSSYVPVSYYSSVERTLFDAIIMKYMQVP